MDIKALEQEVRELMNVPSSRIEDERIITMDGVRYITKDGKLTIHVTAEDMFRAVNRQKNKRNRQHIEYNQSKKGKARKAEYRRRKREEREKDAV